MKRCVIITVVVLAFVPSRGFTADESSVSPQWQQIDQLCGQLERTAPTKKQLVVNGKSQTRLYATYVEYAAMSLHEASGDETIRSRGDARATAQSRKYGAFRFQGVKKGRYMLRVRKGDTSYVVPLNVTDDFDAQKCADPSVARTVFIDANPPRVEVRIR